MAKKREEVQKTLKLTVADSATLDSTNYLPGIFNTLFTMRDGKPYLGKPLVNRLPYTAAITDLAIPVAITNDRITGSYIFDMDNTRVLMIVKEDINIHLYSYSSGIAPTLIQTLTASSANEEEYLEAIFCATEKAAITGYTKYVFLHLSGEAWVVAWNTRLSSWQVEKVNNTYAAWTASTNYSLGNRRIPTVANGYYYEVYADAGSSAAAEPAWPTVIGDLVVDAGITWICRGKYNGFPVTTVPSVKTLNGYIFVCVEGDIYNSDLDLPDSWDASNFISTEVYPDALVGLAKYKNYLVAFGDNTIEFFYDAANTSGTPLARQEGILHNIGCAGNALFTELEDRVLWVSQTGSYSYSIWELDNFKVKKISTPEIDVWLSNIILKQTLTQSFRVDFLFLFLFRQNGRMHLGIPQFSFGTSIGTVILNFYAIDLEVMSVHSFTPFSTGEGTRALNRPFLWNGYYLWLSYNVNKNLNFTILQTDGYNDNTVTNANLEPLFNQTPVFTSKRTDFGSTRNKSIDEIAINAFPSMATSAISISRDRGSFTSYTVPADSFKIYRLGRGREFQFKFTDAVEISDIEIKYREYLN